MHSANVMFYVLVPTLLTTIIVLAVLGPTSWLVHRPALPWAMVAAAFVALGTVWMRTLRWRRAGAGTDGAAMTLRSGGLGLRHIRLTRSRIQSLDVHQNPFQPRAGLANLRAVSVSGSSRATYGVSHMEEAEALRIMRWYEEGLTLPAATVSG